MDAKNIYELSFTKNELKIARFVFKHFKEKFNARQIARELKINHAHTNKLCDVLTKKKIFHQEDLGNASYFTFNYENKNAINFIKYIISIEKQELPKYLATLKYNLEKFEQYTTIIIFFGSAINTEDYNDIDIMMVYDKKDTKKIEEIKEKIIISEILDKPIRYLDLTEQDIKKNLNNKAFYSALSYNIILHGAEKYTEVIKNVKNVKSS